LVILDIQDMDDKGLERAFEGLPIPCVVLLEDVNASAADVSERRRAKQVEPTEKSLSNRPNAEAKAHDSIEPALSRALERMREEHASAMTEFRREQVKSNQTRLRAMEALLNYSGLSTDESTQQQKHEATPPLSNSL
jgi:hypothetical protein